MNPLVKPINTYYDNDFNNLITTGIYAFESKNLTNSPTLKAGYNIILVLNWNNRIITQTIFDSGTQYGTIFFRKRTGTGTNMAWTPWSEKIVSGTLTSQLVSFKSGFELRAGTYVKRHEMVSINLGVTVKTAVAKNAQVDLGTIADSIKPISPIEILLRPFGSGNDAVASVTMGSDGALAIRAILADIPVNSFFWIRTSYFTSD